MWDSQPRNALGLPSWIGRQGGGSDAVVFQPTAHASNTKYLGLLFKTEAGVLQEDAVNSFCGRMPGWSTVQNKLN